jgi:DNA-binding transcriptional ArsR family regulator
VLAQIPLIAKALADENRVRILLSLVPNEKTVSAIVEEVKLSQPLVSHHLKELRISKLVDVQRKGLFVYYRIPDANIIETVSQLATLAENLFNRNQPF